MRVLVKIISIAATYCMIEYEAIKYLVECKELDHINNEWCYINMADLTPDRIIG